MPLYKKLFFFGIGIAMGAVMVYFLFGNRDIQCSYFPNDRVLYDMRKKELLFSEKALCQSEQLAMDSIDLQLLLTASKIDFKNSDTRQEPCGVYHLYLHDFRATPLMAKVENCDSTATILSFEGELVPSCN
jgi:hypothetical protein